MSRNTRNVRQREMGFTLLEVVISVTLIAVMAVAVWAVFRISINSWIRGTEFMDANQRNRSVLDLVKKQMASTYGVNAPPDLQTGVAAYPIFSGTENSVQFVSLNSLRFQENAGVTLVSYDLISNDQGGYSLVERESQYVGIDPARETIFDGSNNDPVVVIFENLMSFAFEYFDPGANERPARWVKQWNAREEQRLPIAISMTMVARDPKGGLLSRHMVVPIMAKPDSRPNFVNPFESRPRRFAEDDPRFVR